MPMAKSVGAPILASHATCSTHPLTGSRNRFEFLILIGMLLVGIGFGFALGSYSHRTPTPSQEASEAVNIDAVVEQIIRVELKRRSQRQKQALQRDGSRSVSPRDVAHPDPSSSA